MAPSGSCSWCCGDLAVVNGRRYTLLVCVYCGRVEEVVKEAAEVAAEPSIVPLESRRPARRPALAAGERASAA